MAFYLCLTDREAMFWAKVNKNGPTPKHDPSLGQCWVWLGCTRFNYGQTRWYSVGISTHRLAYLLLRKRIPEGRELDHLCRNRACCNPWHMEAVTHAVNVGRGQTAIRTHCKHGHPFSEENTGLYTDVVGGKEYIVRHCKTCNRLNARAQYARRRLVRRGCE